MKLLFGGGFLFGTVKEEGRVVELSSVYQLIEYGACNTKIVGLIPGTTRTLKCTRA